MGFDGFPAKPGDIPALNEIRHLKAEIEAEREARAVDEDQIRELLGHVAKLREALERAREWMAHYDMGDEPMLHGQTIAAIDAVLEETKGDGDE